MDFLLRGGALRVIKNMDLAFLGGDSFERGLLPFEVMEARGRVCFKAMEHLDRLLHSIEACGMHLRWHELGLTGDLEHYLYMVLGVAGLAESMVRISMLELEDGEPVLLISVKPKDVNLKKAISLKTMPFIRFIPELKLGGTYAHAQIMLRQYKEYDDVLYVHPYLDVITEASRANFFAVIGTPKHYLLCGARDSSLILPGITRQTFLDILSDKHEVIIHSGELPYGSLGQITEAFVTSTTRRIAPVYKIDGRHVYAGEDLMGGPVTRMFREWFDEYVEKYYAKNAK
ncbi:MAG: aminotransferase class IV [Candidatus Niyogibacteria bacterium]|nr:aminotransferase class IV [Candidatus Niyogibacteria bacterium]